MIQCSHCGANLPDNAQFCLQCGTPAPTSSNVPAEPPPKLDFIQPALAGGLALGVLSSIPIISAGNCFCCMWVLGGGALAAYMLMQQRPGGLITYGDAAFGGVLSGLFGAVVATVLSIPLRWALASTLESQREQLEQYLRDVPPGPMHDLALSMFSSQISVISVIVSFISNLLIFSLFAMLGGILMVAIMQRKKRA